MHFEGRVTYLVSLLHLRDQVELARGGREGRDEVLQRTDVVNHAAWLDHARPAHNARHTPAAFPIRVLFASERCCASIWPETFLRAVVGGEYNDGVAGDSQIVELLQ